MPTSQLDLLDYFWRNWHRMYLRNVPFSHHDIAHAASLCINPETHLTSALHIPCDHTHLPTDSLLRNLALAFTEALRSYDTTAILQIYSTIIIRYERLNRNQTNLAHRTPPDWLTWNWEDNTRPAISKPVHLRR